MKDLLSHPPAVVGALIIALVSILALAAPFLGLPNPEATDILNSYAPPSLEHLFGTDALGRDVLSRTIWGGRSSLIIGLGIVVIGMVFGVTFGLYAAYAAGTVFEEVAIRIIEVFASIPVLVWAIALVGIFGTGDSHIGPFTIGNETKLITMVGLLFFPGIARITHGMALAELQNDYVNARKLQGASVPAILFGDVLPNVLSPLLVQASVLIGIGIIIEASMSFVGLGVQPPTPSWGSMLADSKQTFFTGEYWLSLFPGIAIFCSVIGFNLLGDGLRDFFDPQRQDRKDGPIL